MMNKITLFLLLFTALCIGQHRAIDYIAYSDNNYYEILAQKGTVEVVKYHLNNCKLQEETLHFVSLNEAKKKLQFEILVKSKKLQKELYIYPKESLNKPNFEPLAKTEKIKSIHRRFGLDFKTENDTLYSFQFNANGNKELWYLSGNDSLEVYDRFWCKPKKQPTFISINHKKFDVLLVQRGAKLSLIYFDKKKGIQGNIRF